MTKNLKTTLLIVFALLVGVPAIGAITMDKSTFDHGIEILEGGLDIISGDLDVDVSSDFSGDVNISSTITMSGENTLTGTTSIPTLDATFQLALDFQQATSSGGVEIEGTQFIPGSVQNTGGDLLCTDVWLDVSTANGIFGYTLKVGTSTSATTTDGHLIADTRVTTSTTDILNKEDDEGTSSTEVWDLNHGEYIVVTETFDIVNATSSASLTAAGANATAGTLHVNCRTRY